MKVQALGNDLTFGNTDGGIRYLRIIKDGSNIKFTEIPQAISDVGVFVAGGSGIDRIVREANAKIPTKPINEAAITKQKSGVMKFFERLLRK